MIIKQEGDRFFLLDNDGKILGRFATRAQARAKSKIIRAKGHGIKPGTKPRFRENFKK